MNAITDIGYVFSKQLGSRNDDVDVTDTSPHENVKVSSRNALEPIDCFLCHRRLRDAEPVYVFSYYFQCAHRWAVRSCAEHARHDFHTHKTDSWAAQKRQYCDPKPCECCGRTVHRESVRTGWVNSKFRTYCTDRCRYRDANRRAALQRKGLRRAITCWCCHASFKPRRLDAKFCSSACRQNEYRARKAVRS